MPGIIAEGKLALPQNEERAKDAARDKDYAGCREESDDPIKWDAGDGEHHHAEQDKRAAAIPFGPELPGLGQCQKAPRNQRDAEDQPAHAVPIEIDSSVGSKPDHQRAQQQKDEFHQQLR